MKIHFTSTDTLLEIESRHIGALFQKGISIFNNFSFEITRNHLEARKPLKLLTQLTERLRGGKFKIDQSEGHTSLKNMTNSGGNVTISLTS